MGGNRIMSEKIYSHEMWKLLLRDSILNGVDCVDFYIVAVDKNGGFSTHSSLCSVNALGLIEAQRLVLQQKIIKTLKEKND